MRRVTQQEMAAVLRLDGPARYAHFVKFVADTEEVWSVWQDGWALFEDDGGRRLFPLWPAKVYAEACCSGEWAGCEARQIPLSELLDERLQTLRSENVLVVVFPTPEGKGVIPELDALEESLMTELERYA